MIPKKIHYCWYGGNEKDWLSRKCLKSLRKLNDYEIIEWNERNCDVTEIPFVQQAYAAKKYAFVSDYFRLKALYTWGGVYIDTDVEIRKPFSEDMLNRDLVLGYMYENTLSTAVIMATPKHPFIKGLIERYQQMSFSGELPNNSIITQEFIRHFPNEKIDGKTKNIEGNGLILECHYFEMPTYDPTAGYTIHHFNGSWHSCKSRIRDFIKPLFVRIKFSIFAFNYWYQNYKVLPRFRGS